MTFVVPQMAIERSSLYRRAFRFHRALWGRTCACRKASHPCDDCHQEIVQLTGLLDEVVHDAIDVTMRAKERFGE